MRSNSVKGDLSDGNKKFREALKNTVLDAPNGKFTLDENRQAIGPNFVTEVVPKKGDLVSKVVKVVPSVNQRLGFSKEVFDRIGLPGREVPECKKKVTTSSRQQAKLSAAPLGRPKSTGCRRYRSPLCVHESQCMHGVRSHVAVLVVSAAIARLDYAPVRAPQRGFSHLAPHVKVNRL